MGTLESGTDADVIVFDPDKQFTISAEDNASNATYSIYDSVDVAGGVDTTVVRGQRIVGESELVGSPGER